MPCLALPRATFRTSFTFSHDRSHQNPAPWLPSNTLSRMLALTRNVAFIPAPARLETATRPIFSVLLPETTFPYMVRLPALWELTPVKPLAVIVFPASRMSLASTDTPAAALRVTALSSRTTPLACEMIAAGFLR